jgi:hypothetical protein
MMFKFGQKKTGRIGWKYSLYYSQTKVKVYKNAKYSFYSNQTKMPHNDFVLKTGSYVLVSEYILNFIRTFSFILKYFKMFVKC